MEHFSILNLLEKTKNCLSETPIYVSCMDKESFNPVLINENSLFGTYLMMEDDELIFIMEVGGTISIGELRETVQNYNVNKHSSMTIDLEDGFYEYVTDAVVLKNKIILY